MNCRRSRILFLAGTLLLPLTCIGSVQPHCVIGANDSQQDESKRTFRFRSGDGASSTWNRASGIENPRTLASLEQHIQKLSEEQGFSGVVLIANDGQAILQTAVGLADFDRGIPNTLNAPFNLGSGNKMFTAVAIAQLAQQRKLRFSDVISAHIPNYANKAIADKVTIHHLLTHTSGLPDYWDDEYEKHWERITSLRQFLPFFAGKPLVFEPGTRFAYSNSNFIILGLIIEAVTEQSYFEYVKMHIFDPLEMAGTDSYLKDGSVRNLALGYVDDSADDPRGKTAWQLARHNLKGSSAGGGYSRRLRFNEDQRRRLTVKGKRLGRRVLRKLGTMVIPRAGRSIKEGCRAEIGVVVLVPVGPDDGDGAADRGGAAAASLYRQQTGITQALSREADPFQPSFHLQPAVLASKLEEGIVLLIGR